jgi:hypothetical protein
MRLARFSFVRVLTAPALACLALLLLGGCASRARRGADAGGASSAGGSDASAARASLPGTLASPWTPPAFSTRQVSGSRAAVFDAALAAVNELGYSVGRLDGAGGRLFATRRQAGNFDGAREYRLELRVIELAPESVDLRVVLREVVEDAEGRVSMGLLRDRAPYDSIFDRVKEKLGQPARP